MEKKNKPKFPHIQKLQARIKNHLGDDEDEDKNSEIIEETTMKKGMTYEEFAKEFGLPKSDPNSTNLPVKDDKSKISNELKRKR